MCAEEPTNLFLIVQGQVRDAVQRLSLDDEVDAYLSEPLRVLQASIHVRSDDGGLDPARCRAAVQGLGNVGSHAALGLRAAAWWRSSRGPSPWMCPGC